MKETSARGARVDGQVRSIELVAEELKEHEREDDSARWSGDTTSSAQRIPYNLTSVYVS